MKLAWNRYGKSRVRLVWVDRSTTQHTLRDLTVDVQLEGAFESVYVEGDNTACLATDTMKNTVYALARAHGVVSPEAFAERLTQHFANQAAVERVIVSIAEQPWQRLAVHGTPHPHAFVQAGAEEWTTVVSRSAAECTVRSGVRQLVVLKTTDSAFEGFPRDEYTTLPETAERILATSVTATWLYNTNVTDYLVRNAVREVLLDTFALHDSRSVQHTLYAMAEAVLKRCEVVDEITLTMPNRHHLLVDLQPFGLDNPNEVFVATDQPFGLIEATVRRASSVSAPSAR